MTKNEWLFIVCFTYLAILSTLSIVYWLNGSVDRWLVSVNYLMIVAPCFYAGIRLVRCGRRKQKRRLRNKSRISEAKRLAANAGGVVLLLCGVALLVHTMVLWM